MTLDLAKLRAETLALIDGTTPGPWYEGSHVPASGSVWIGGRGEDGGGAVLPYLAKTMNWPENYSANAALIAAAPTLAADTLRLLDEIERLKRALVEAAIPLEAMILAAQDDTAGRRLYGEPLWNGIVAGVEAVRTALAKGGPNDR